MTAQARDEFIVRERRFTIEAFTGKGLFEPAQQGLSPAMLSTSCYRGYWCTYEAIEDSLRLNQLHIGLWPKDMLAAQHGEGPRLFGQRPVHAGKAHLFVYRNLSAPVPFTGGILITSDFIQELSLHPGHEPVWKFREVHELLFEKGRQVRARDCSSEMATIRESMENPQTGPTGFWETMKLRRRVAACLTRRYRL